MGMRRGTTICDKHNAIINAAKELRTIADDIVSHAEDALEDGQSMEEGLKEHKKESVEFETMYDDLRSNIEKECGKVDENDLVSLQTFYSNISSLT